jgi:integrase
MHLPIPAQPANDCAPYYQLDGNPVVPAWRSTLSAAVLEVVGNCGRADLVALRRLANFVSANQAELQANAKIAETASISPPSGSQVRHPVCTVLLLRRSNRDVSPALDLLFAAMCEAAFEAASDPERRQIAALTSALRGALERAPNSRLQVLLGGSRTLAEVHGRLEGAFSTQEKQPTLASHWRSWFGARIHGWLLRDRARLRKALEPTDLIPPVDAPAITIQSDIEGDPDDTLDAPVASTVWEPGEKEIPSFDTERRRARANALERASEGDLLSNPDWYLPVELIRKIAIGALASAQRHLADGENAKAESYAALALAVATGLRDSDLADLRWGAQAPTDTTGKSRPAPRLDIDKPLMYWPIIRPKSVSRTSDPSPAMERTVDVLEWPLPPKVHELMRGLCGNAPRSGACAFPSHERGENLPLALHDVVTRICAGIFAGAGVVRRALASELARALGPDVAQLVLADAFSHSVAPTYYAAPQVSAVTSAIRLIHVRWFGESADVGNREGVFGSRIIPTDDASREWPSSLYAQRRSAAHRKQGAAVDGWIAHRNFLAGSLASATGHRPVDAIGKIDIHDVIPEHGLIILRDKQIDPLRRIRVAATGALWTSELRDYLDRLIDLSKAAEEPGVTELAAKVLRGDAPLLSAPSPTGEAFGSATLVATMPEAFQKVRNHYRHRLNQQLLWRTVDPELRYAQMGWVISPAYFTADLSPSSATDLARYVGPTIDQIMIDDGWFSSGRRLAKWRWDGIPMPPMQDWDSVAAEHVKDHKEEVNRLREAWIARGKETELKILPRLADAIRTVLPKLRLDVAARCLVWAPEYWRHDPVEVDTEHCELMINIVRTQDERAFEALETATM